MNTEPSASKTKSILCVIASGLGHLLLALSALAIFLMIYKLLMPSVPGNGDGGAMVVVLMLIASAITGLCGGSLLLLVGKSRRSKPFAWIGMAMGIFPAACLLIVMMSHGVLTR